MNAFPFACLSRRRRGSRCPLVARVVAWVLLLSTLVGAQEIDRSLLASLREACAARERLFARFRGQWRLEEYGNDNKKILRELEIEVTSRFPSLRIVASGESAAKGRIDYEEIIDLSGRRLHDRVNGTVITDEKGKPDYLSGQKIEAANEVFVTHAGEPLTTYLKDEFLVSCSFREAGEALVEVVARASFSDQFQYRFLFDSKRQFASVSRQTMFRRDPRLEWSICYSITTRAWKKRAGFALPSESVVVSYDSSRTFTTWHYWIKELSFPSTVKVRNTLLGSPAFDRNAGVYVGDHEAEAERAQELRALLSSAQERIASPSRQDVIKAPWLLRWGNAASWVAWIVAGVAILQVSGARSSRQRRRLAILAVVTFSAIALGLSSVRQSMAGELRWRDVVDLGVRPDVKKTCGIDSLYLALKQLGHDRQYSGLVDAVPLDLVRGSSLRGLQAGLASLGIKSTISMDDSNLEAQSSEVTILHLIDNHFVVQLAQRDGCCVIIDPSGAVLSIENIYLEHFLSGWRLDIGD